MSSAAVNRKIGMGEWGADAKYTAEVSYLSESAVATVLAEGKFSNNELQKAVSSAVE